MKLFNKYIVLTILAGFITLSCEDEELKEKNFPGWETAVNGFGQFQDGSATNFIRGDLSVDLDMSFRWISIDAGNEASQIEFFVNWEESYLNPDGDPAVANHGTESVLVVDSPPSNREDLTFTITQSQLYTAFQAATFDYDEDGNEISVFNNPDKPNRDTNSQPFIDGDSFTLSWEITTTDGRLFDSWSPSVCTELPGSNCQLSWIVECGQVILEPAQDYTIVMNDSYGDGWNDAAIRVIVDGNATDYTLASGSSGTTVVTVPTGTQTLSFEFVSGDWDSEVTFSITTEKGNEIASGGPSPSPGPITLDLCTENE